MEAIVSTQGGKLPRAEDYRTADHPIEPIFLHRWSPRAMNAEPLSQEEILTLFEAARWAPSTYNEQEWRFLYALRDTPNWPVFMDILVEANRTWCANAGMLCVITARKVFQRNRKPNPVHVFDAGLAFENLALQGSAMGLVVHGMSGFDYEKARTALAVPEDYAVCAMFAAGHPGDPKDLPAPLREREEPSQRKPVHEIIREGPFAFDAG